MEKSEKGPDCQRRTGRQYRRRKGPEKADRLLAIIRTACYGPHRGYVDCVFQGKTLLHTGKYIKYPKNSKCQRLLKRVSRKKVWVCPNLPQKGSGYRKVFDYCGRFIKKYPLIDYDERLIIYSNYSIM